MTILTMVLLIVVDVLAIVSLIWNIRSVRRAEYALKKINKRVKDLEKRRTGLTTVEYPAEVDDEKVDTEQEEENNSIPTNQDNG